MGSGRAFCDARAATCSMLTSRVTESAGARVHKTDVRSPLPVWANATSASAT
jgi:hypothetical protein